MAMVLLCIQEKFIEMPVCFSEISCCLYIYIYIHGLNIFSGIDKIFNKKHKIKFSERQSFTKYMYFNSGDIRPLIIVCVYIYINIMPRIWLYLGIH